jgi:hypothetical protein
VSGRNAPRSSRACMRKPSYLISCSHWSPSGAASTSLVNCGRIQSGRAGGSARERGATDRAMPGAARGLRCRGMASLGLGKSRRAAVAIGCQFRQQARQAIGRFVAQPAHRLGKIQFYSGSVVTAASRRMVPSSDITQIVVFSSETSKRRYFIAHHPQQHVGALGRQRHTLADHVLTSGRLCYCHIPQLTIFDHDGTLHAPF